MKIYFSGETNGFYHEGTGAKVPEDAVKVSPSEYEELRAIIRQGFTVQVKDGVATKGMRATAPPPANEAECVALRLSAYRAESDPLKNEAEYDALISGEPVDLTKWAAKVAEIKERFPLP